MKARWPIGMKRAAKHGWLFSGFAGMFATAVVWAVAVPDGAMVVLVGVFSMAFAAARAAGWIARVFGAEDHGWIAGAITAPLFATVAEVTVAQGDPFNSPLLSLVPVFVYISILVFPFCMLGTMMFQGLLLWSDPRGRER